ncbi:hypothetical protein [uncultured Draconibacterium sp.]
MKTEINYVIVFFEIELLIRVLALLFAIKLFEELLVTCSFAIITIV